MPNLFGLYSGISYFHYRYANTGDVDNIDVLINDLVRDNKADNIVCLTMCPTDFLGYYEGGTGIWNPSQADKEYTTEINGNIDGYVPQNKKLFTFPYNFLTVDCLNDTHNYKYELFQSFEDTDSIKFDVNFTMQPNPQIMITPKNYNNLHVPLSNNYTESLIMEGFPQCACAIDSYRAWLAQNANANALDKLSAGVGVVSGAASVAGGVASGSALMTVYGGTSIANSLIGYAKSVNDELVASTKGSTIRGTQANGARMAKRAMNIYFKQMCVKAENAKVIDDFFTRFGYAVNRIQLPNINARTRFTYVKTVDASVRGNIPTSDLVKIKENFNKGITFFNHITRIGDFEVTSSDPNATY